MSYCNCAYYGYFEGGQGEPIPIASANLFLSEELSSFMTSF